uniref:Uncharacterized protein n=1 Tax=Bursaphelenchus xylophilus TaxID=6326 RepID=A0A1I7SGF1_BURXY
MMFEWSFHQYYLSLVFQEDCPLYTALLEEHKSELMNAYVKLVKTSAGTSTIANETTDNFFENNQPAVFGSSVCAFVIFLILVGGVLLFAYKKRKLLPEEEDEE